jgi:hypothetical protein
MDISEKGTPNDALISQMGEIPVLITQQRLAYYLTGSGHIDDKSGTTKEPWFDSRKG